jgi:hypothetical protein
MLKKFLILVGFLGALGASTGIWPTMMSIYDSSYVVTYVMPLWLLVLSIIAMFVSMTQLFNIMKETTKTIQEKYY